VTTTTFDLVSTTAMGWLMVRAVVRESGACVLAAGVVVGVGVEAKPPVGFVAAVIAATLIAVGPRSLVRSWWAAGGLSLRRCWLSHISSGSSSTVGHN
jgi:4-amino-4-deoxy-L-arabinose transferase-like glycosyltransferase